MIRKITNQHSKIEKKFNWQVQIFLTAMILILFLHPVWGCSWHGISARKIHLHSPSNSNFGMWIFPLAIDVNIISSWNCFQYWDHENFTFLKRMFHRTRPSKSIVLVNDWLLQGCSRTKEMIRHPSAVTWPVKREEVKEWNLISLEELGT